MTSGPDRRLAPAREPPSVAAAGAAGATIGRRVLATHPALLHLQRLAGNAAVTAALSGSRPLGPEPAVAVTAAAVDAPPAPRIEPPAPPEQPAVSPPVDAPSGGAGKVPGPSELPSARPAGDLDQGGPVPESASSAGQTHAAAAQVAVDAAVSRAAGAADRVEAVERPADTSDAAAPVVEALLDAERQGRAQLAVAAQTAAGSIGVAAAAHATTITATGAEAGERIQASTTQGSAGITAAKASNDTKITAAKTMATGRVSSWSMSSSAQLTGAFDQAHSQITDATGQQATAARNAGNTAAAGVAARADNAGAAANPGAGGGGSEQEQGRAAVRTKVGGQAAATIHEQGAKAKTELTAGGADAATQLTNTGREAAAALDSGRAEATTGVKSAAAAATGHLEQAAAHGTAALDGQHAEAQQQLATYGTAAKQRITGAADHHAAAIGTTAITAANELHGKVTAVIEAGRKVTATKTAELATSTPTAEQAAEGRDQVHAGMSDLYGQAAGATSQRAATTGGTLAAAASGSAGAVHAAAGTVGQHIDKGVADHSTAAADLAVRAGEATGKISDQTVGKGGVAVSGAAAALRSDADAAVAGLGRMSTAATEHLQSHVAEVGSGLQQAAGDATSKIGQGITRFDDAYGRRKEATKPVQSVHVQRDVLGWLKGQWSDFLNMVTDPAFLVGLAVTLILSPLGPLAIVVGGMAGGVVSGIMKNKAQGKNWYDWSNIGWGLLEGALIGVVFAIAAAALIYFNVGLLAGALIMGGLSALVGIGLNLYHGQPWDKNLLANFFLAAILHLIGGAIKAKGGVKVPGIEKPGAYSAVDPTYEPGNFTFKDTVDTRSGPDVRVTTEVTEAKTGATGKSERAYFIADKRLVMISVDLSKIPSEARWVEPTPGAKPVRLESYMTMRAMKLIEAEVQKQNPGGDGPFVGKRMVRMSNVVNVDTVMQLAKAGQPGTAARAAALRTCKSVQYAERSIQASGSRIVSVSESGGMRTTAGAGASAETLAKYQMSPNDPVQIGMSIDIEVEPAGVDPQVGPVPQGDRQDQDAGAQ